MAKDFYKLHQEKIQNARDGDPEAIQEIIDQYEIIGIRPASRRGDTKPIHLKKILLEALDRENETIDDIVAISIPLELMDHMTTLEEIQCYYLWQQPDKQHLPLVAVTAKNIYYHHNEWGDPTTIIIDASPNGIEVVPGVEVYPIKDHIPYNEDTIKHMKNKKKEGFL